MSIYEKIAEKLYDLAERHNAIDRLIRYFSNPFEIILIGPTGVGKSRVGQVLSNDYKGLSKALTRTLAARAIPVKYAIKPLVVIDTPGHILGEIEREKAIKRILKLESYGIILVGAYGYHESSDIREPALRKNGSINESFLENKRRLEGSFFNKYLERVLFSKNTRFVFTMANKSDMWINQWPDVREHYSNCPHSKLITDAQVPHEVVKYCAKPQKFWRNNNCIPKIDGDDAYEQQEEFLEFLSQFVL